jgi:N6-adenosine-specific RNA methylase IME4
MVVDPPWRYTSRQLDFTHRVRTPYPDMSIEEISSLPIPKLAHDDCVLWALVHEFFYCGSVRTGAGLGLHSENRAHVGEAQHRSGHWLRGQTEHCLMAVRGHPIVSLTNQSTALHAPVREHSRKPEEFYRLVDSLCPGNKLEMFARESRTGWTAWDFVRPDDAAVRRVKKPPQGPDAQRSTSPNLPPCWRSDRLQEPSAFVGIDPLCAGKIGFPRGCL